MNLVLEIPFGGKTKRTVLQGGFYRNDLASGNLHSHLYGEIHVLSGGGASFSVNGRMCSFPADSLFFFPKGSRHKCLSVESGCRHTAFQWEADEGRVLSVPFSAPLLKAFFQVLTSVAGPGGDHGELALYLGLFARALFSPETVVPVPVTDPSYLIEDYLAREYWRDATLQELATRCCLSEKQTAREVKKLTGMTFSRALSARRGEMARELEKTGRYTQSEIALAVGYTSYSGYWKAQKKKKLD